MDISQEDVDNVLVGIGGFVAGYLLFTLICYLFIETVIWMGEYQRQMIREVYRDIALEQKIGG